MVVPQDRRHDRVIEQCVHRGEIGKFPKLRGPTYIAVIADEAAFFRSEEFSANVDAEILNAVRPGLATTNGPLIVASSPYAKRGVVWDAYKSHYGPDGDPKVLVVQGASRTFNPTLDEGVVARALQRDHAAASAEYLGLFRNDIESAFTLEAVEACVGDYREAMSRSGVRYHGFVDPSGGSQDSMTCAVAHREGDAIYIDAIREYRPKFSPRGRLCRDGAVVQEL
jgi:hypothetical protein